MDTAIRPLAWIACTAALYIIPNLASAQTIEQRAAAANTTATTTPACTALPKFYWEIGDASSMITSGTYGSSPPSGSTQMNISSASTWVYGAYVYQRLGGSLTSNDVRSLRMMDGRPDTNTCLLQKTVGGCQRAMNTQDAFNRFYYSSGHYQKHAALDRSLGNMTKAQLGTEVHTYLGNDWTLTYARVDLAGGANSSASEYGKFLRKILSGSILLSGNALGSYAVCTYTGATDAATGRVNCPSSAYSPIDEAWSYSLGHWVETDPVWLAGGGDAAFSSPGVGGFYPWIDAGKNWYGILARVDNGPGASAASVACGRLIRKAWLTGTPN